MESPIPTEPSEVDHPEPGYSTPVIPSRRRIRWAAWLNKRTRTLFWVLLTLIAFLGGSLGGYQLGIHQTPSTSETNSKAESEKAQQAHALAMQVNPSQGYVIPARLGSLGPKLLAAGAIDYPKFEQVYAQSGQPLSEEQKKILNEGVDQDITINAQNAYFFLNFFWALGLVNHNPVLTEGPMMANGKEQVGSFASTGGWTIGAKSPIDLYDSAPILSLTSAQQDLLDQVTDAVYRPCCDNPTHFPDCNHGMAMLGLLELMASQNATKDQMFQAAKYVNAFWYPQQYLEIATLFHVLQNVDFDHADARQVVSAKYSSGSSFQAVHQYLVSNNLLEQGGSQGGSCGV